MANDSNIKNFTALDIEKYHKGLLSHTEMHALEKAALDDPFLADALEGYAVPGVNVDADIIELKKRLAPKTENAKVVPISRTTGSSFPWLRAAVVVILIAGAGLLSYQFLFKQKPVNDLAKAEQKKTVPGTDELKKDSLKDQVPGSNLVSVQPANIDTTGIGGKRNKSTTDILADDKAGSTKYEDFIATDRPDEAKRSTSDTSNYKLEVETNAPSTNVIAKTPVEKSLQGKVAGVEVKKENVSVADDFAKSKKVAKPTDSDGDGVADKVDKETKFAEVAVVGYGNQKNEELRRQTDPYNRMFSYQGRITDANNNPLPFANITNTRDNVGTRTDAKGNYSMISTDSMLSVQIKALGFENNSVQLRGDTKEGRIVMQEDRSVAEKIVDTSKRSYAVRSRNASMTFEEPEPADGWVAYNSYVANNLNMPDNFDKKKSGGDVAAVEVSFEVNKYGEPVNIKVEKSLCDKCDKEAIRLIKEGPKWKRKARKGRTTVSIPFNQ